MGPNRIFILHIRIQRRQKVDKHAQMYDVDGKGKTIKSSPPLLKELSCRKIEIFYARSLARPWQGKDDPQ